jgi:hypothetical protein
MRALAVIMLAAATASAQTNYCAKDAIADTEVWVVDKDSQLPTGLSVSDVIRLFDSSLSNLARTSRAKIRQRMSSSTTSDCTTGIGTGPSCIEFRNTDDELCAGVERGNCTPGCYFCCNIGDVCLVNPDSDTGGSCEHQCTSDNDCPSIGERCSVTGTGAPPGTQGTCVSRGILGYANEYAGRGWVVMCTTSQNTNQDEAMDYVNNRAAHYTSRHELVHTFGLSHSDAEALDGNGNSLPDGCTGDNLTGCQTTSPGACQGELMCSSLGCGIGPSLQLGDSRGLREKYNGAASSFTQRSAYVGNISPVSGPSYTALATKWAIHQPRIDCAESLTAANECVMVRHRVDGGVPMMRVDTLNGNTTALADDNIQEADSAPDIAISDNGRTAWIVWAERGRPMLRRVPLTSNGGTVSEIELQWPGGLTPAGLTTGIRHDTLGGTQYWGLDLYAVYPPRVAVAGGQVIVAVYASGAGAQSGSFLPPRMRYFRFAGNITGAPQFIQLDFAYDTSGLGAPVDAPLSNKRFIPGEFDIDCWGSECTLVAPRMRISSQGNVNDGLVASTNISYSGAQPTFTEWLYNYDYLDVNSVVGVARGAGGTYISTGVRTTGGATNSRYNLHPVVAGVGTTIGTVTNGTSYVSDAQTCASTTKHGETFPANTMLVGGNSIAIGANSIRIAAWGNQSGSNFCF